MTEPLLVPAKEAFRLIGVGRDAGYRLIREGRLKVVRVGALALVPRSECVAFVDREAVARDD